MKQLSVTCTGKSVEVVIAELKQLAEEYNEKYYVSLFLWNENLRVQSIKAHIEDLEKMKDSQ